MGVQGLWELLAPVGRRVSVETLAGKRLAIDASIWMIQFMKAMRDEKGEMVRNAHILGFFRRICKLLFLRTKPVFVFDGGTPALKRRTVVARRRQRENAQAKIRKTAEKLLLNHLKTMRLKELANDLENQRRENGGKGKKVVTDETENALGGNETVSKSYNQEAADEMLAASLAAEGGGFTCDASTSGAGIVADDEDEDEEMVLPNLQGKIDPDVLAALPPSMQLDLLVQMRERLMAENRQKYQKVKKAPAKFSELQIQAYLKTVAFRREINEVQKSAGGRGIGGVQTSRIASEANREFIFSSSFTGDRQVLASAGVDGNRNEQSPIPKKHLSSDSVDDGAPMKKSNTEILSSMDGPTRPFHEDVETYLDERGRVRVSKVRAMGIRMTRDLQRNLELMKEIEQQRKEPKKITNDKSNTDGATVGVAGKLPVEIDQPEISHQGDDRTLTSNRKKDETIPITGTSIEVSFDDDNQQKIVDSYDDLFAQIVAGDPVASFSNDNSPSRRQTSGSALDCVWEEGATADFKVVNKSPPTGGGMSGESEVEWEEDAPYIPEHDSLSRTAYGKADSKGALEEEADFQEAIRRSIEDVQSQKDIESGSEKLKDDGNLAGMGVSFGSFYLEEDKVEPRLPLDNGVQSNEPSLKVDSGFVERLDTVGEINILAADDSPRTLLMDEPCESHLKYQLEISREDASGDGNSQSETGCIEPIIPITEKTANLTSKLLKDDATGGGEMLICTKFGTGVGSHTFDSLMVDMPDITLANAQQSGFDVVLNDQSKGTPDSMDSFAKVASAGNLVHNFDEKRDWSDLSEERVVASGTSYSANRSKEQVKILEARLEEEMLNLNKERIDLGEERRKIERNAESVSSEMFAECQELLQMFGLPYIIAPMEAEAQCAYMELEKLVDGVVTDDSDVLLFGARSVFKNIFDDHKYVETYFMKDIENELGLTREKLIRMALLLGSDYTEGVSGIGIVNAVEVLTAFPEEDGLQKFREWIESPDPTILGKVTPRKKGSNSSAAGASAPNQSGDDTESTKQSFMDKHRNVSKNWHIPSSFPSEAVISAYASPQVDRSTEPFSWGKPDLFILRKLCWEKFGWGTQKADELLQPVLKEYNKHETQLRLEAFYTFNERFAKIRSKRISKAVKGITGNRSVELVDDSARDAGRKKRKVRRKEEIDDKNKELSCSVGGTVTRDNTNPAETPAGKQSRKSRTLESSVGERGSGSGRGSGRGRSKGQLNGRGKRKEKSILVFGGTSSDDDNNSNDDQEGHSELYEGSHKVRRSTRARKAVKYTVDDFEIDDSGKRNEEPVDAAAAVDLSGSNHHEVGDPSIENDLFWDNLEMGGEFCMAEAALELNPQDSDQNGDTLPMEESSKEYLHMGGGFCLEEDEVEESASSPARTMSFGNPDLSHGSGLVEEAERDIGLSQMDPGPVKELNEPRVEGKTEASESRQELCSSDVADDSRVAMSRDNIEKDDSEARPMGFLSAMPNLRRKRRKS